MTQGWLFEFHYFKIKIMMMDGFDLFTVAFLDSRTGPRHLNELMAAHRSRSRLDHLAICESEFLSKLRCPVKISLYLLSVSVDFDI